MKVMIVAPYFYPKVGGLENYVLNIAKGLKRRGHEVFVVTSNHESKTRVEETVQGLRVIRLPRLIKLSNTPVNPAWRGQLREIIKIEQPDVINAHTPVPFIADMTERVRGRVPFVLTYHNDLLKASLLGNFLAKTYNLLFTRKTLRRSDSIIATSEHYANSSPYLAKHKDKLQIVSPGVDTAKFNLHADGTWLKKKYPSKKIVLFVGSLQKTHAHKGMDVLLQAIAQARKTNPAIQLVAVGNGDAIPAYKQMAETLGIAESVHFTGYVADKALPRYYAGADVFVLPSTTSPEGFGMVLVEAIACGTPVIGSNVGGIPFALKNGGGLLVEPANVKQLAKAIKDTLRKPTEITATAKLIEEEFNWKNGSTLTLNFLKRATLPRVCLVHNIISPYRLPVYEAINKDVNFTVLFCKPITKDRVWTYDLQDYTFNYAVLNGFSLGPVIFNWQAFRAIRRTNFDVVMANSDPDIAPTALLAFLWAKLKRKRVIVWSLVTDENIHFFPSLAYSDNYLRKTLRRVLSKSVMAYRRLCFALADHFLAFTGQAQSFLEAQGVAPVKISRTYQIMPPELLPEPTNKAKRGGRTFLYLGYLNERKGVNYLIDAFKRLSDKDARLIIAGSGPTEKRLKQLAKTDSRINFAGYVEGSAKANLYSRADVFVLPTLLDVWGLVINEAIHYGLAIICSDAAVAQELITKSVGRIIKPADVEGLSRVMADIIKDQQRLREIQAHNLRNHTVSDISKAKDGYLHAIQAVMPAGYEA